MYHVGDEVVLMSFPGRFRIVAIEGQVLMLENDAGVQKRVLSSSVRVVHPRQREQAE
jgi:hypothetical protein